MLWIPTNSMNASTDLIYPVFTYYEDFINHTPDSIKKLSLTAGRQDKQADTSMTWRDPRVRRRGGSRGKEKMEWAAVPLIFLCWVSGSWAQFLFPPYTPFSFFSPSLHFLFPLLPPSVETGSHSEADWTELTIQPKLGLNPWNICLRLECWD